MEGATLSSTLEEALRKVGLIPEGQAFCGDGSALLPNRETVQFMTGSSTPPDGFVPIVPSPGGWLEVVTDDFMGTRAAWQDAEVYEALQALGRYEEPSKVLLQPEFVAGLDIVKPQDGKPFGVIRHMLRGRDRNDCSLPVQTRDDEIFQHLCNVKLVLSAAALLRADSRSITSNLVVPAKAYWVNLALAQTRAGKPCLRQPAHKVVAGAFVVADGYVGLPELDVAPASTVLRATPFWSDTAFSGIGTPNAQRMAAFIRPGEVLYLGWEHGLTFNGESVLECSTLS